MQINPPPGPLMPYDTGRSARHGAWTEFRRIPTNVPGSSYLFDFVPVVPYHRLEVEHFGGVQVGSILYGHLQSGPMSNHDNQDGGRNVRDRIATFVQAHGQSKGKQVTDEEFQTLRRAVGRLDQLLADAAADEQARRKRAKEEESQALRVAAARLDQLLTDIAKKEAAPGLKLRHTRKKDMTE
jgi:hypothetical protein